MADGFKFKIIKKDGNARTGVLSTIRGDIPTPAFMPVGTKAAVKTLDPLEVADSGASILLGNTYHLMLRPGEELIKKAGGLSKFMSWNRPTLTDSGGFQVFSLGKQVKLSDEGVVFSSHIDGSRVNLTPERAMHVQAALGSDIAMVLDECPAYDVSRDEVIKAMERTTMWAKRQIKIQRPDGQALFGIVQGGIHADLRIQHLEQIASMDFDGIALGGLSVGEDILDMYNILKKTAPKMPLKKPRYLMGVGTPQDIVEAVSDGIDLFDCVMPTRNARNGQAFVQGGKINIKNARYTEDEEPLDPKCNCPACRRFSRMYIRHLYNTGEMLALRLLTIHNLFHWGNLMREIRQAIKTGNFNKLKTEIQQSQRNFKKKPTRINHS